MRHLSISFDYDIIEKDYKLKGYDFESAKIEYLVYRLYDGLEQLELSHHFGLNLQGCYPFDFCITHNGVQIHTYSLLFHHILNKIT